MAGFIVPPEPGFIRRMRLGLAESDRDQEAWDRFAAAAMQGALANPKVDNTATNDHFAEVSAALADAMMAERAKRKKVTK